MYRTELSPLSTEASSLIPGIYEHYKGLQYKLISIARHSETLEEYAVYQALYGDQSIWVRPLSLFLNTVIKDGVAIPRFRYIKNSKK